VNRRLEEQEMMKHEVAQRTWTAQQAQGYFSGWSTVVISKGGANVGRIIFRVQERNLNAIGRKHKGGWEAVND
jgi:hypothetical protein